VLATADLASTRAHGVRNRHQLRQEPELVEGVRDALLLGDDVSVSALIP
jgi:hypothetical protein